MADKPKGPVLINNAGTIGRLEITRSTLVGVDAVRNVGEIGSISITDTLHAKGREELLALVIAELLRKGEKLATEEREALAELPATIEECDQQERETKLSWLAQLVKKVAATAAEEGVKMLMRAYGLAP